MIPGGLKKYRKRLSAAGHIRAERGYNMPGGALLWDIV